MFNLEKKEKFILLALLAILLLGLLVGSYQKRSAYVDVKPGSVNYSTDAVPQDASTEGSKVNINEAGTEALMKLKGVGKALADRIIEYRSTNGRFIFVEDLKKVKGFGGKLYDKIKSEVSVD
jgi:competence protein ComEA helix-hairpin-helix repeat region